MINIVLASPDTEDTMFSVPLAVLNHITKHKDGGFAFEQSFYDLGLSEKLKFLRAWEKAGLLNNTNTQVRVANALLQHSSDEMKRTHPVQYERKISKTARTIDENELQTFIHQVLSDGQISLKDAAAFFGLDYDEVLNDYE